MDWELKQKQKPSLLPETVGKAGGKSLSLPRDLMFSAPSIAVAD